MFYSSFYFYCNKSLQTATLHNNTKYKVDYKSLLREFDNN